MQELAQDEAPGPPPQAVLPMLPSQGSGRSLTGENTGQLSRGASTKSLKGQETPVKPNLGPLGKADLDSLKRCPTSGALITYEPKAAYEFDSSDEEDVPLKNKRAEPSRQLGVQGGRDGKHRMVGTHYFAPRVYVQGDHAKHLDMEDDTWGMSDLASVPASKMMTHRYSRGGSETSSVLSAKATAIMSMRGSVTRSTSAPSRPSTSGQLQQRRDSRASSSRGSRASSKMTSAASVQSRNTGFSRSTGMTGLSRSSAMTTRTNGTDYTSLTADSDRLRNITKAAARACGFQEQKKTPARHSSLPKSAYNWTGGDSLDMCKSEAPSRLVARAVDAAKLHVPTEDRSDFMAFRSKMSEKEKDMDHALVNYGAHVIAAYDARIEGGRPVKASIVKELFDYFCGMRGIGLGLGIPEGSGLMVVSEYIKLIRDLLPDISTSGTTLSHLFTHTKRIENNPIEWDKKMWGNETFAEPKKVKFTEWLCLMVRVAVVAYGKDTHLDCVRAMAEDFRFAEGMKAFRKRLEEYQRSGGGFGDGWVDDRLPEAPPKLTRATSIKGQGTCRKFEDQVAALDADDEEMKRCVNLLLDLGSDSSAIPWIMFPGPYLAMVVPTTGHPTSGSDIMKAKDGPPPHKFQVVVKNVSDSNQQFFLGLQDLPMFSYLYTPKVQINGDHIEDFKKAKNNFVAPGSSMNFLLCAHVPEVGSFQGKISVRDSEHGDAFFTIPVYLRVVPPERVARARTPEPEPEPLPEPVVYKFPEIEWDEPASPPAPKLPHRVFDRVSGTYMQQRPPLGAVGPAAALGAEFQAGGYDAQRLHRGGGEALGSGQQQRGGGHGEPRRPTSTPGTGPRPGTNASGTVPRGFKGGPPSPPSRESRGEGSPRTKAGGHLGSPGHRHPRKAPVVVLAENE